MRAALLVLIGCGRVGFSPVGDAGRPGDAPSDSPPLGTHAATLRASNADPGDQFGLSIALASDGMTLAVGAPTEASAATGIDGNQADNTATDAGAVYVFVRSGDAWTQQAYIKASNAGTGDQFGWAVALSADGNTLAVGARDEASAATDVGGNQADNSMTKAGAAYVFTRAGMTWTQQAYVKASNTGANDQFGSTLALADDGSTLVVGASLEDSAATGVNGNANDETATDAGAAYVYRRGVSGWSRVAYLKASNTDPGDWFGWRVAISGDGTTIFSGAINEASASATMPADNSVGFSGAVYVFTGGGATWVAGPMLKASNPVAGANFGYSAYADRDATTIVAGAIDEPSGARGFGGDQGDQSATNAGAAYVMTGPPYVVQAYAKEPNTDPGDSFGWTVALAADGSTLLAGAPFEAGAATGLDGDDTLNSATDSGAAYLATRAGTTWTYRHYIKASNTGAGDNFGWAVGLSADGATAAIGSPEEDGPTDAAMNCGAVYLYY